jgi:hypothetical protein
VKIGFLDFDGVMSHSFVPPVILDEIDLEHRTDRHVKTAAD